LRFHTEFNTLRFADAADVQSRAPPMRFYTDFNTLHYADTADVRNRALLMRFHTDVNTLCFADTADVRNRAPPMRFYTDFNTLRGKFDAVSFRAARLMTFCPANLRKSHQNKNLCIKSPFFLPCK